MPATTRRAMRVRAPEEPCLNCGDTTPGRYCPACGQRKTEVLVSVRAMLADVLEDQLVLNPALPRTLTGLLFRPGWLTTEYVTGRIVRYIAPFRLYLVSSIVFFLILSFVGLARFENVNVGTSTGSGVNFSFGRPGESGDTTAGGDAPADTTAIPAVTPTTVREAIQVAAREAAEEGDSATAAALENAAAGGMQDWTRQFASDSTADSAFERAIQRKVAQYGHLEGREAGIAILRDLLEYAPHMVFLMLPLYALLLKILYIRRKRYYAEHFVFALHVHAFFFVMFTLIFLLPTQLDIVLYLWMIAYVWIAMKRVYAQGWFRTTVKWWTLGWSYSFIVMFGLVGLAFATLMLT